MNRTEFIVATSIVLFVAFLLGWFAAWIVQRLSRVSHADLGEIDKMAQAMHDAEEARDQAMAYLQAREAEMANQIAQTEAELRAAMDGLRDARQDAEEMRSYIERLTQNA